MLVQTRKIEKIFIILLLLLVFIFILYSTAHAELNSSGILDTVYLKYAKATKTWATEIEKVATNIFISLMTISMVWTFAQLMFHRSSFAEFFGELIRFITFSGVYLWFLQKGPLLADAIIKSFIALAGKASGQGMTKPSDIVDLGFQVAEKTWAKMNFMGNFGESLLCGIIAFIILAILALVAINMLLQLCSAWVLAYAGIIFLGFGGSKWTSDMAINYFKTVISVGASLMTMMLLVGIGKEIVFDCFNQMSGQINMNEVAIMFVSSLTLLILVEKLPAMVAGIITGASIGQAISTGSFGAGAAVGAGMTAGRMSMKTGGMAAKMTGISAAAGMAKSGAKTVAKAGARSLASAAFRQMGGK